jgi:pimeloyl-ACP methyl ester carboxylesterase
LGDGRLRGIDRAGARDLEAPLRRIPGAKHFTSEDHPEIVAEEIEALIDSL